MNVPVRPTRPPWARESRFGYVDLRDGPNHPGPVVSTGSTTRTRGLDRLDQPRLRGLDRSSMQPGLRVIELVEITARESVELVDERTRLADTPAVARESRCGYVDLRDMVDHRPPWSRQARPPEVARARPVRGAT